MQIPSLRCGKVEFDVQKKVEYFPPNIRKLLPSSYYTQFKAWHHHFMIPLDKQKDKDKEWIDNFVFNTHIKEVYVQRNHSNLNDCAELPLGTA